MPAPFPETLIRAVRDRFWYASEDSHGRERIFFDSAAGSLVLKAAHAAIERYSRMSSYGGASYPDSTVINELAEAARRSVAVLINAGPSRDIFTGESTTAVLRRLAEAVLRDLPDRSRIIVSAADHNANIDPWRQTAIELPSKSLDVQMVRFEDRTGRIDLNHFEDLASDRLRLVAVSHASNVLGAENPMAEIKEILQRRAPDALLTVDGVHFISHGPVDVQSMGADAYVFSTYKLFGQRGLSYAFLSPRLAQRPHYKLAPAPDDPPESWELGFRNPADLAPIIDVVRYLAWLGSRFTTSPYSQTEIPDRALVALGHQKIREYESGLVRAMIEGVAGKPGLAALEGVSLHGVREPTHYPFKEPTFSFNIHGARSRQVESILRQEFNIDLRSGNYYAPETHKQLGVSSSVRASLAHYNTIEEVEQFLEATGYIANRALSAHDPGSETVGALAR